MKYLCLQVEVLLDRYTIHLEESLLSISHAFSEKIRERRKTYTETHFFRFLFSGARVTWSQFRAAFQSLHWGCPAGDHRRRPSTSSPGSPRRQGWSTPQPPGRRGAVPVNVWAQEDSQHKVAGREEWQSSGLQTRILITLPKELGLAGLCILFSRSFIPGRCWTIRVLPSMLAWPNLMKKWVLEFLQCNYLIFFQLVATSVSNRRYPYTDENDDMKNVSTVFEQHHPQTLC